MKYNKINPEAKSDKIQKKIDSIFKNRARNSKSCISRIPKQTPANYILNNCKSDKLNKKK